MRGETALIRVTRTAKSCCPFLSFSPCPSKEHTAQAELGSCSLPLRCVSVVDNSSMELSEEKLLHPESSFKDVRFGHSG